MPFFLIRAFPASFRHIHELPRSVAGAYRSAGQDVLTGVPLFAPSLLSLSGDRFPAAFASVPGAGTPRRYNPYLICQNFMYATGCGSQHKKKTGRIRDLPVFPSGLFAAFRVRAVFARYRSVISVFCPFRTARSLTVGTGRYPVRSFRRLQMQGIPRSGCRCPGKMDRIDRDTADLSAARTFDLYHSHAFRPGVE